MKYNRCIVKTVIMCVCAVVCLPHATMASYAGQGIFTKITSINDLSDGYYVIANGPDEFAMSSSNSGSFFIETAISPVNDTLTDPPLSLVWKIETDSNGRTIYNEESGKLVSYSGSSNAAYQQDPPATDNERWIFTYETDVFVCENLAVQGRRLRYNPTSPRFACYSTTFGQNLSLFKLDDGGVTPSNRVVMTAPPHSLTKYIGEPIEIITESWSNFTAYIGYGPTDSGVGWNWFPATVTPGGIGYRASMDITPPFGTHYVAARWVDEENNRIYYGTDADGSINVASLAATIDVTVIPGVILPTPWDLANGDITGISHGDGMSAFVPQLPSGFFVDFEDATSSGYAMSTTIFNGVEWEIGPQALVASSQAGDMKHGNNAARMRLDADVYGQIVMAEDVAGGFTNISLYAARSNFSGDRTGVAPSFVIEYSTDQGDTWTMIGGTNDLDGVEILTLFSYEYTVTQPVRIRIRQTAGDTGKRWNVDDISLALPGEGPYTGILFTDGFSHDMTRDPSTHLTFAANTTGYENPGFYCAVRRTEDGPRFIDIDFYNGMTWQTETITFDLPQHDQWYTIGRSYELTGNADTQFRLVGYGASASILEVTDIQVTAIPEPGIIAIVLLGAAAFTRRFL